MGTNHISVAPGKKHSATKITLMHDDKVIGFGFYHSYDILGAGMLWKPKETRILTNFIDQPVNIR
jgi:hypothetical protein